MPRPSAAAAAVWLYCFVCALVWLTYHLPKHSTAREFDLGVCVIARVYRGTLQNTAAFVLSLASSAYSGLHVFLLRTDPTDLNTSIYLSLVTKLNQLSNYSLVHVLDVDGNSGLASFSIPLPTKDYGYVSTDLALEKLLAGTVADFCSRSWSAVVDYGSRRRHPACLGDQTQYLCKYILVTNGDNLYATQLLPSLLKNLQPERRKAVAWNFISHHKWPRRSAGICPAAGGSFVHMSVDYKVARVDLGAVMFRADQLRENATLRFVVHHLRDGKKLSEHHVWNADGLFFERLLQGKHLSDDFKRLHNAFMVHQ